MARTVVLDHRVRMQDVGADLAPEGDLLLFGLQLLALTFSFGLEVLVQTGLEEGASRFPDCGADCARPGSGPRCRSGCG